MLFRRIVLSSLALVLAGLAHAATTVSIAAAANLTYVLDALSAEFGRSTPEVRITTALGASGNLYAQIAQGAPFDIFLSADTEYPERLARNGLGDRKTLRTFAVGRLVLWTTKPNLNPGDIAALVRDLRVKKLAIAQPKTAPFGRAAQSALEQLGLWSAAQPKLVIGENISQTAQFVDTGNADAGFVALSLVLSTRLAHRGKWAEVPPSLYAGVPLDQACILTNHGAGNAAARHFLQFLQSPRAREILATFGYGAPHAP